MTTTITQTIRPYDVEVARNEFLDPEFATGVAPVNHQNMTNFAVVAASGFNWGKGESSSTGTTGMRLSPNANRRATAPGERVYVKVLVKNPNAGSRSFRVGVIHYDTAGATTGTITSQTLNTSTILAAGAEQVLAVDSVAPDGTVSTAVTVWRDTGTGATVGDLVYARSVYCGLQDVAPFYGHTPDTVDFQYAWTGVPSVSPSIKLERAAASDPLSPQLLLTESFNMEAEIRSQVHPLLGGVPDDVDLESAGPRRGTLQLLFTDRAEAIRGFEMHRNASLFELDDPDFGEMTYVPQGVVRLALDPRTRLQMVLETGFTEVTP